MHSACLQLPLPPPQQQQEQCLSEAVLQPPALVLACWQELLAGAALVLLLWVLEQARNGQLQLHLAWLAQVSVLMLVQLQQVLAPYQLVPLYPLPLPCQLFLLCQLVLHRLLALHGLRCCSAGWPVQGQQLLPASCVQGQRLSPASQAEVQLGPVQLGLQALPVCPVGSQPPPCQGSEQQQALGQLALLLLLLLQGLLQQAAAVQGLLQVPPWLVAGQAAAVLTVWAVPAPQHRQLLAGAAAALLRLAPARWGTWAPAELRYAAGAA